MHPHRISFLVARFRAERLCRELFRFAFVFAALVMLTGEVAFGGDIFRTAPAAGAATNSGATATGSGVAAAPLGSTIDMAAQLQARAQAAIQRTDTAIRAVQTAQQAARAAAVSMTRIRIDLPEVKEGLTAGGLEPLDLSKMALWKGAGAPTAADGKPNEVTIVQNEQQALLQWKTFSIGKDTTLTFDQSKGGTTAGQWVAFNFVQDPDAKPSQILGKLKTVGNGAADAQGNRPVGGQVYVLNPNGILFGGASQVNVHALVASSLPINSNLVQRGLLDNPDAQFLFSALTQAAGSATAAFDPAVATDYSPVQTPTGGLYGDVKVEAGAQLTAPASSDHVGGRIALIGPNVTNAGTIRTPDGQTILAAGMQVGMAAHDSTDPTLRGLDVYIGKVADVSLPNQPAAGTATNAADSLIDAPRGNVYITGKDVVQTGGIDSVTSVAYNGRVDLVASYNAISNTAYGQGGSVTDKPFLYSTSEPVEPVSPDSAPDAAVPGAAAPLVPVYTAPAATESLSTGVVTLGANSLVRILPEVGSADKVVGDLALRSLVNVLGDSVHFASGAEILAPGAGVNPAKPATSVDLPGISLTAGVSVRAGGWYLNYTGGNNAEYQFVNTSDRQQIFLDSGARISVAGTAGAQASVTDNIISVELRGSETADSPVQRDSPLRGQTVQVDLRQHGDWDPSLKAGLGGYKWVGTPLADTAGWVNLVQHDVSQLTVDGGSVALTAGGAVVLKPGAQIDVSGGYTAFAGGTVKTTKVLSGGNVYDLSQATPDRKYTGIYTGTKTTTDPKWGTITTDTDPFFGGTTEAAYTQGGNAGRLSIVATTLALDGALQGNWTAGVRQRTLVPSSIYRPGALPTTATTGVPGWLLGADRLPLYGQLSLALRRDVLETIPSSSALKFYQVSSAPANVLFAPTASLANTAAVGSFSSTGVYDFALRRDSKVELSSSLVRNADGGGFGMLAIDNSYDNRGASMGYGDIGFAPGVAPGLPGVSVDLPVGGTLLLKAGNITVGEGAQVRAASGAFQFEAYSVSTSANQLLADGALTPSTDGQLPVYDGSRGRISVAKRAMLSTAGALVDQRPGSESAAAPLLVNGGAIALVGNDVAVRAGATLDVSGGATVSLSGKVAYDNGGKLSLKAGRPLGSAAGSALGGTVTLDGVLRGYAGLGKKGGTVELQAPAIRVGPLAAGTTDAAGILRLKPEFFENGGFAAFSATGLGFALDEKTGAFAKAVSAVNLAGTVAPRVWNWTNLPGGALGRQPEGVPSPVDLSFATAGDLKLPSGTFLQNDLTLVLEKGAVLRADPGGKLALNAGYLEVLGTLKANAGSVSLSATGGGFGVQNSVPNLHLGDVSVVDASGAVVSVADAYGLHSSDVRDGGSITVEGNIVAEKGARLDVSGTVGGISLLPGVSDSDAFSSPTRLLDTVNKQSNGGRLTLAGTEMMLTAASLRGEAGGSDARAGELSIFSGYYAQDPKTEDSGLRVYQQVPSFQYHGLGFKVTDELGRPLSGVDGLGVGRFGIDSLMSSGGKPLFGALTLGSSGTNVEFHGPVSITMPRQLTVAPGGVLALGEGTIAVDGTLAPTAVVLQAPYIRLGVDFKTSGSVSNKITDPTAGIGSLTVRAKALLDIGDLVVRGSGNNWFEAPPTGSLRGSGTLEIAGTLDLVAGQIYPPTGGNFSVVVRDTADAEGNVTGGLLRVKRAAAPPGAESVLPALPYSAGGTLGLYATTIEQGGVLRAPLGTINLGAATATIEDPVTATNLPTTSRLTLLSGGTTSVSAVDPVTGKGVEIPYGVNVNGGTWYAPSATDITATGPAAKHVNLSAVAIDQQAGAKVDLAGGGDLFSYRFVPGAGGTIDILDAENSRGSFAVFPANAIGEVPYSLFPVVSEVFGSDRGYNWTTSSASYRVGDRVHLEGLGEFPAGDYVILPARYALLDGSYLITPRSTAATAGAALSATQADGSVVMSGFRFNALENPSASSAVFGLYEVAAHSVVAKRAEYVISGANQFFTDIAKKSDAVVPRLPGDGGQLVVRVDQSLVAALQTVDEVAGIQVQAVRESLALNGTISAAGAAGASGARGGMVDLASTSDLLIGNADAVATAGPDQLALRASNLSTIGAESLLIGGVRTIGKTGLAVETTTAHLTLDNKGEALSGLDVTLVASESLTLAEGAQLRATAAAPSSFATDPVLLGDETKDGSGNGVLVRVSADSKAKTVRAGLSAAPVIEPSLTIGSGATLSGAAVLADSTWIAAIDPAASLAGANVTLGSRRISVLLDNPGTIQTADSLVLSGAALQSLQSGGGGLSLQSYSTIDLYGTGTVGSPSLGSLGLHTGALCGFNVGIDGVVRLIARDLQLDNAGLGDASAADPAATPPVVTPAAAGTLQLSADGAAAGTGILTLGANDLLIRQFATVKIGATGGILAEKTGSLTVAGGDLTLTAPALVAAAASNQAIKADGNLYVVAPTGGTAGALVSGLGGKLALQGAAVSIATDITVPSGAIAVRATTGDLTLAGAKLNVRGTSKAFFDVIQYTAGGSIALTADAGRIAIGTGSKLDLSAQAGGGDAGSVSFVSPEGNLALVKDVLAGTAGAGGRGGSFSADAQAVSADGTLADLHSILRDGGFSEKVALRIRQGAVALDPIIDPVTKAPRAFRVHEYSLSADKGDITVTGMIDASGRLGASREKSLDGTIDPVNPTGGSISLAASGSVVLAPTAWLTAAGYLYDNAGKGGSILLSAGGYTDAGYSFDANGVGAIKSPAVIDLRAGSQIDLGVKQKLTVREWQASGGSLAGVSTRTDLTTGTLHLRAPVTLAADGTTLAGIAIEPLRGWIYGASSIVAEGFRVYDLTATGGLIDTAVQQRAKADATALGNRGDAITNKLLSALPADAAPDIASKLHLQPGVEIVNRNTSTDTRTMVVLNTAATLASARSSFAVQLKAGTGATLKALSGITVDPLATTITNPATALKLNSPVTFAVGSSTALGTLAGGGNSLTITSTKALTMVVTYGDGSAKPYSVPTTVAGLTYTATGTETKIVFSTTSTAVATYSVKKNAIRAYDLLAALGGGVPAGNNLKITSKTATETLEITYVDGTSTSTKIPVTGLTYVATGAESGIGIKGILATKGSSFTANQVEITPSTVELAIPGGLAGGGAFNLAAPATWKDARYQVNYADAGPVEPAQAITGIAGVNYIVPAGRMVKSITLVNGSTTISGSSAAVTIGLLYDPKKSAADGTLAASAAPVAFALPAGTTFAGTQYTLPTGEKIASLSKAISYTASAGDLTLANSWDFSAWRFGPKAEPGNLTLRAQGNVVLGYSASLNDGFDASAANPYHRFWTAPLMQGASWSYRLVGGADYSAADPLAVASGSTAGVRLGVGSPALPITTGPTVTRSAIIPQFFQTVRTGTGSIELVAAGDVLFLNPLATLYTAGAGVANPRNLYSTDTSVPDFDLPSLALDVDKYSNPSVRSAVLGPWSTAQYSAAGGDVAIRAGGDIKRLKLDKGVLTDDSSKEMPTNWLYRRGLVDDTGRFAALQPFVGLDKDLFAGEIQSTSWWIDFTNFFADVGALGGGNVTLAAAGSVRNIQASVPTNARMPGKGLDGNPVVPDTSKLVELGGGDLLVRAGGDIDAGAYYVERGSASLRAGGGVITNQTRAVPTKNVPSTLEVDWLPATFFLGKGRLEVAAAGDIRIGSVANPFWLPQGAGNRLYEKTYFTTFGDDSAVEVGSLGGTITIQNQDANISLSGWYKSVFHVGATYNLTKTQPWLCINEVSSTTNVNWFTLSQTLSGKMPVSVFSILPGTLRATGFSDDIFVRGSLPLAPAPKGTVELLTAGSINAFQSATATSAAINLSDADPNRLPTITTPFAFTAYTKDTPSGAFLDAPINALFAETGRTALGLAEKLALHGRAADAQGNLVPLHQNDTEPVRLYATGGDLSGLTLFSGKTVRVLAVRDITDVALYVQNLHADDTALVAAGRDMLPFKPDSALRLAAGVGVPDPAGVTAPGRTNPNSGDIQIAGPGTLAVVAGRDLDLGTGKVDTPTSGVALGLTTVGAMRNPYLKSGDGAAIVAVAGAAPIMPASAAKLPSHPAGAGAAAALPVATIPGLGAGAFQLDAFAAKYLDPASALGTRYLPVVAGWLDLAKGTAPSEVRTTFDALPPERRSLLVLDLFTRVLRDAGRDRNDPTSAGYRSYAPAYAAIRTLVPGSLYKETPDAANPASGDPTIKLAGDLSMATRLIKTFEGGDISILVPGGGVTVGRASDPQTPDQGILTQFGGDISVFTQNSVAVGTSRIFTLRGGNELIWSSLGDIAAGSGSKTVAAAPPTRVLVDPASGDVQNDLAGLATGSGIGVLATLKGVAPGDIDLIAPVGTIDAGDAGIRSSGNLNIASLHVANAANIATGGSSAGVPAVTAPSIGGVAAAASSANAGTTKTAASETAASTRQTLRTQELPSLIQVEVLGYGGSGDSDTEEAKRGTDEEEEAKRKAAEEEVKRKTEEESPPPAAAAQAVGPAQG